MFFGAIFHRAELPALMNLARLIRDERLRKDDFISGPRSRAGVSGKVTRHRAKLNMDERFRRRKLSVRIFFPGRFFHGMHPYRERQSGSITPFLNHLGLIESNPDSASQRIRESNKPGSPARKRMGVEQCWPRSWRTRSGS
jgi:hypothetical protein